MKTEKNDTEYDELEDEFSRLLNDFISGQMSESHEPQQDEDKQLSFGFDDDDDDDDEDYDENESPNEDYAPCDQRDWIPAPETYCVEKINVYINDHSNSDDSYEIYGRKNDYNIVETKITFDEDQWNSLIEDRSNIKPVILRLYDDEGFMCDEQIIEDMCERKKNTRQVMFDILAGFGRYRIEILNCWRLGINDEHLSAENIRNDGDADKIVQYFSILPKGDLLPAPKILTAEVICSQDAVATFDNMRLHLQLHTGQDMCRYRAVCCNSSGCVVAQSDTAGSESDVKLKHKDYRTNRDNHLMLDLSPNKIWYEDTYSIYLYQNDFPVSKLVFDINGGSKKVLECKTIMLPVDSDEVFLAAKLLSKDAWTEKLSNVPRFTDARRKLVTLLKKWELDRMRYKRTRHESQSFGGHIAVIGAEGCVDAVFTIHDLIGSGGYVYGADCTQLVERSNNGTVLGNKLDECLSDNNIIYFYNIDVYLNPDGIEPLKKIADAAINQSRRLYLSFSSYSEFEQLVSMEPRFAKLCPESNRISFGEMTMNDYMNVVLAHIHKDGYSLSQVATRKLYALLCKAYKNGDLYHLSNDELFEIVDKHIIANQNKRIYSNAAAMYGDGDIDMSLISETDIDDCFAGLHSCGGFDEAMAEINEMVGLDDLKKRLTDHFNMLQLRKLRSDMGLSVQETAANHMLFMGNPGTGKTTVARLMGKVCRALGILSKGDVVVTDRAHIVGQFIGDTERNMLTIINQARGNVLFIDEAYSLAPENNPRDFGFRALDVLLPILSQKNPDMVVIFAGYENDIQHMLQCNQGLSGRFPHHFVFADYSESELIEIGEKYIAKCGYVMEVQAREVFAKSISGAYATKQRSFSNARWVEQFVDMGILPSMAARLSKICSGTKLTREQLSTIESADVKNALTRVMANQKPSRRAVGF